MSTTTAPAATTTRKITPYGPRISATIPWDSDVLAEVGIVGYLNRRSSGIGASPEPRVTHEVTAGPVPNSGRVENGVKAAFLWG